MARISIQKERELVLKIIMKLIKVNNNLQVLTALSLGNQ